MGSLERTAGPLWLGMRPSYHLFLFKILAFHQQWSIYQITIKMIALKSNSQANGSVLHHFINQAENNSCSNIFMEIINSKTNLPRINKHEHKKVEL